MIRTLIFDLGRVIVPFDFQRAYQHFAALTRRTPEEFASILRGKGWFPELESGRLGVDKFHRAMLDLFELEVELEDFREGWSSIFERRTLLTDEFLEALHRNHRLVLLSNTNGLHFPWIQRHFPILHHFDELVLSYEVGAMKPEAKIYEAAIRAAQCEPAEAFYTDDIVEYVDAGRQHGLQAFVFESQEQTERDLRGLGVSW